MSRIGDSGENELISQLRGFLRDSIPRHPSVGTVTRIGLKAVHVRLNDTGTLLKDIDVIGGTNSLSEGSTIYLLYFSDNRIVGLNPSLSGTGKTTGGAGAPTASTPPVGGLSGSGVNEQIAFWTGASTLGGASGFTFDGSSVAIPGALLMQNGQAIIWQPGSNPGGASTYYNASNYLVLYNSAQGYANGGGIQLTITLTNTSVPSLYWQEDPGIPNRTQLLVPNGGMGANVIIGGANGDIIFETTGGSGGNNRVQFPGEVDIVGPLKLDSYIFDLDSTDMTIDPYGATPGQVLTYNVDGKWRPADTATPSTLADEWPPEAINGVNDTFSLINTPITNSLELFLNGILINEGSGNDFTLSGTTITMLAIPQTGDHLRARYTY